jgi:hypothetical protein
MVRDRETKNPGVYLGTVTKVDGPTAYVTIPRLAPGYDYPARYPRELRSPYWTDFEAVAGAYDGAPRHRHLFIPLAVGDDVAVAFLEGGRDELVVLIRLA